MSRFSDGQKRMRGVVYLVLEEAHEFAPKERTGIGAESMAIHYAKQLATAGRSKGIRIDQDKLRAIIGTAVQEAKFRRPCARKSLGSTPSWRRSRRCRPPIRLQSRRLIATDSSAVSGGDLRMPSHRRVSHSMCTGT